MFLPDNTFSLNLVAAFQAYLKEFFFLVETFFIFSLYIISFYLQRFTIFYKN